MLQSNLCVIFWTKTLGMESSDAQGSFRKNLGDAPVDLVIDCLCGMKLVS